MGRLAGALKEVACSNVSQAVDELLEILDASNALAVIESQNVSKLLLEIKLLHEVLHGASFLMHRKFREFAGTLRYFRLLPHDFAKFQRTLFFFCDTKLNDNEQETCYEEVASITRGTAFQAISSLMSVVQVAGEDIFDECFICSAEVTAKQTLLAGTRYVQLLISSWVWVWR